MVVKKQIEETFDTILERKKESLNNRLRVERALHETWQIRPFQTREGFFKLTEDLTRIFLDTCFPDRYTEFYPHLGREFEWFMQKTERELTCYPIKNSDNKKRYQPVWEDMKRVMESSFKMEPIEPGKPDGFTTHSWKEESP